MAYNEIDGVLLIDKPSGMTSHDVVDRVRRHFNLKKVGHCGTLDPMATGLLVLVLGRSTKLSDRLISEDKEYEGTMRLGVTTDSQDADGEVLETRPLPDLTLDRVCQEAEAFKGDIHQVPPMVSAKKIGGQPLYKLARKGKEVAREPRLIHIYRFEFTEFAPPELKFRLLCTKGTYVRTICHDLGAKLGCGAHLSQLRRTASGSLTLADAKPLDEILRLNFSGLRALVKNPLDLQLPLV
jgi:tRNA pseudouridine55 synthase